jgi:hypothetical protein
MFGALSSASTLSDVVFEIELLADNVIKATKPTKASSRPTLKERCYERLEQVADGAAWRCQ